MIEQTTSGRFRAIVQFKGQRRTSKSVATRDVARMLEAQLLVEMGGTPDRSENSVEQLLTGYLAEARERLSPTTMAQHDRSFAILPMTFRNRRVATVTPFLIDQLYAELRRPTKGKAGAVKVGASEFRCESVHKLLSVAFGRAVKYGWCVTNPVRDVTKPKPTWREIRPPTDQEVQTLMAAAVAVNPLLPLFFRVSANTGARRGEVVALKWVDVNDGELVIRRSIVEVGGRLTERSTKTGSKGHRPVALDAGTSAELEAHRTAQARAAIDAAMPVPVYVISHPLGELPWRPNYVTLAFRRLAKACGIDSRLHDLRHFMATRWLVAGEAPLTVAGRLGHSTTATTLRTYAHFVPASDKEAAGRLAI